MRPAHLPRKRTIDLIVTCDQCNSHKNVRKSYRLNRNLQPTYRRLCTRHRQELGYQAVEHTRPYADIKFYEAL